MNIKQPSGWLPRDERKLLVRYYRELGQVGIKGRFYINKTAECLAGKNTVNRLINATETLKRRDLIIFQVRQGDAYTIGLTLEGYDLARKYSRWFTYSGLWFAEFKHHWFWIIVAFVGGIVAKVVIELIVKWLTGNST